MLIVTVKDVVQAVVVGLFLLACLFVTGWTFVSWLVERWRRWREKKKPRMW